MRRDSNELKFVKKSLMKFQNATDAKSFRFRVKINLSFENLKTTNENDLKLGLRIYEMFLWSLSSNRIVCTRHGQDLTLVPGATCWRIIHKTLAEQL